MASRLLSGCWTRSACGCAGEDNVIRILAHKFPPPLLKIFICHFSSQAIIPHVLKFVLSVPVSFSVSYWRWVKVFSNFIIMVDFYCVLNL